MKKENFGYVVFLSVVAAIGGILFGYDTAVISGTTSIVATQFGLDRMVCGLCSYRVDSRCGFGGCHK